MTNGGVRQLGWRRGAGYVDAGVGVAVGVAVGAGTALGDGDGGGPADGATDSDGVGVAVGDALGATLGSLVGAAVGTAVGRGVGRTPQVVAFDGRRVVPPGSSGIVSTPVGSVPGSGNSRAASSRIAAMSGNWIEPRESNASRTRGWLMTAR